MPGPCDSVVGIVDAVAAAAPPLKITLPGGLEISGIANAISADALTQARALIASANAALAPLGPIFKIIDAIFAFKAFAESVPDVLTNPGSVVEAVIEIGRKVGSLGALIPQLSVPIMMLGILDAIIAFLNGVALQFDAIAAQQLRIEEARALVADAPCLAIILDDADAQMDQQSANLAAALSDVRPLIGVINVFASLASLPQVELVVDTDGGAAEVASSIRAAAGVMQTFRDSIPI